MKTDKSKGSWIRKLVGLAAIISIPVSAFAVVYDTHGYFQDWLGIGSGGASGQNHALTVGFGNNHWAGNTMTAGSYLITYDENSTVVGQWNIDTGGDEAFVVGNGTGSGDKRNALEVYKNGDVIVPKAQGDIDMGIFGQ